MRGMLATDPKIQSKQFLSISGWRAVTRCKISPPSHQLTLPARDGAAPEEVLFYGVPRRLPFLTLKVT